MDNIDLTEFDEADIMLLEEDVITPDKDYAFFGSESGYAHFIIFEEGRTKRLINHE